MSRRGLLTGAAAGGGLLVAWLAWPTPERAPLVPSAKAHAFGAWLTIGRDGVVTVAVPQLEMGQGVTTVLPQIVAEELGADWRLVAVQPAPPAPVYANVPLAARWAPLWMPALAEVAGDGNSWLAGRFARRRAFTATAAGTSLAAFEEPCRIAGASARAMLVEAAAARWGVSAAECRVWAGQVTHGAKRLPFGALAGEAAELSPPGDPPLRPRPTGLRDPSLGRPARIAHPRLDLPSKATGAALFAGDIRLPGMVFASIRHGSVGRPNLAQFDINGAKGVPGLVQVVRSPRWLAAVADSWWSADRALDAMRPRFAGAEPADSAQMTRALDRALEEDGELIASRGDAAADAGPASHTATYRIAPAVHATIETASATARVSGGRLELWMAAQSPATALAAAARAVNLDPADAVLYPVPAGGSFDARLDHAHAIEAAVIAEAVGRPVQLTWPRRQELLALPPRAPVHARLAARIERGSDQRVVQLTARYAAPPSMIEFGHRLFDNHTPQSAIAAAEGVADPLALDGAMPPYAIDRVAVRHVPVTLPLPTGPLRGNGAAVSAFCTESFMDELAERVGREPLSWRIAMLGDDPRLAACLLHVAGMAQWNGAARGTDGSGRGHGLACARLGAMEGAGRIACIAQVERHGGAVRVVRLYAAVDLGRIVNKDIAHQQIEGGLIFGHALAVGSAARYRSGLPETDRLRGLRIPALADSPQVVVQFMHQPDMPAHDPGEIGAVVAPPAIANALFAATGQRVRTLPLFGTNA